MFISYYQQVSYKHHVNYLYLYHIKILNINQISCMYNLLVCIYLINKTKNIDDNNKELSLPTQLLTL